MQLLEPGDPGYDEARDTWNARFESRPALIAQPETPDDVAAALDLAAQRSLDVCLKSGGHDYAGNSACDGGLLIDLGPMNSVTVDPDARRAVVGAGARWAAVDAACQAHGLVTPGGTVSTVGVTGFTLGGGQGWLLRKHGLACDNLVGVEMVTVDGDVVRATETENPELLWGLRGGGANLGIVTSLELALHPLDHPVLAGQVVYPLARAGELLRFYRDELEGAPDELMCYPFFYRVPPLEFFDEAWHGQIVLSLVVAYMGPAEEGEAVLAPFRNQGEPILDGVFEQSYVDLQQSFDAGMGPGGRWYTRAHNLDALTDACIDTIVERVPPLPGDFTTVYLGPEGGAAGRHAEDATAYPSRSAAHSIHVFPGWVEPSADEEIMSWARGVSEAIEPFANGGVYVNLLGEDEAARVPAAYGSNYARLSALKAEWDPRNRLRSNHNVHPES